MTTNGVRTGVANQELCLSAIEEVTNETRKHNTKLFIVHLIPILNNFFCLRRNLCASLCNVLNCHNFCIDSGDDNGQLTSEMNSSNIGSM